MCNFFDTIEVSAVNWKIRAKVLSILSWIKYGKDFWFLMLIDSIFTLNQSEYLVNSFIFCLSELGP